MALDATVFDADLAAVIGDLPGSLSWDTYSSVACALSELDVAQTLVLAGNLDERHFECVFQSSQVGGGVPAPTDRITITSFGSNVPVNYEVVRARTSADGVGIHCILKADHRN